MRKNGRFLGGILLIAGTSIGGGMLGLPLLTSLGGFFPAIVIFFFCWLCMCLTGLLFLEVSLWMKKDVNIITMTKETLGNRIASLATFIYFALFYTLTLSYVIGGGQFLSQLVMLPFPEWTAPLFFILLFAPFIYGGASYINKINFLLMFGLVLSYFSFVYMGYSKIEPTYLQRIDWPHAFIALPIAFTSFAYQGTIPSLVNYLERDINKVRLAIIIGSFIPFTIYIFWEALILGIIPFEGHYGLLETLQSGGIATAPLQYHLQNEEILFAGHCFAFFALTTSFLGVTLGLRDFIADGLAHYSSKKNRPLIYIILFLPPLLGAWSNPGIFLRALNVAGGFGCASLLGILPVLMVWKGRLKFSKPNSYRVFGGFFLLLILFLMISCVIGFEVAQELGWSSLPSSEETLP